MTKAQRDIAAAIRCCMIETINADLFNCGQSRDKMLAKLCQLAEDTAHAFAKENTDFYPGEFLAACDPGVKKFP